MDRPRIPAEEELYCLAPHPDRRRIVRLRRTHCGSALGAIPFPVRATGRVLGRSDEAHPGMVALICSRCRMVTEFEVVVPEETAA